MERHSLNGKTRCDVPRVYDVSKKVANDENTLQWALFDAIGERYFLEKCWQIIDPSDEIDLDIVCGILVKAQGEQEGKIGIKTIDQAFDGDEVIKIEGGGVKTGPHERNDTLLLIVQSDDALVIRGRSMVRFVRRVEDANDERPSRAVDYRWS
ncbi:hypothetical protein MMC21_002471 [Puttea exsequens]|nr:hypothetical protein [Puttea exsequens]